MGHPSRPLARSERLLIEELENEVVVYDLDNDSAHLLNSTLAAVWRRCDGSNSAHQIAAELHDSAEEEVVWEALAELERADLLTSPVVLPGGRLSRRQVLRTIGVAAAAAPVIVTVLAQPAAAAASAGLPIGATCGTDAQCASCNCAGGQTKTCAPCTGKANACTTGNCANAGFTSCNSGSGNCN